VCESYGIRGGAAECDAIEGVSNVSAGEESARLGTKGKRKDEDGKATSCANNCYNLTFTRSDAHSFTTVSKKSLKRVDQEDKLGIGRKH
jgi:hypothetical protein